MVDGTSEQFDIEKLNDDVQNTVMRERILRKEIDEILEKYEKEFDMNKID